MVAREQRRAALGGGGNGALPTSGRPGGGQLADPAGEGSDEPLLSTALLEQLGSVRHGTVGPEGAEQAEQGGHVEDGTDGT